MRDGVRFVKRTSFYAFRRGDLLAIAFVALLAVVVLMANFHRWEDGGGFVQIYQNGALVREQSLHSDGEFEITGQYTNHVMISNGKVAVTASDCPGIDCVHSGWISEAGRSIVCLPNRLEIRISGDSDVDFTVG